MANELMVSEYAQKQVVVLDTSIESLNWKKTRDEIIAEGATITQITNETELEKATAVAKAAKKCRKVLENERKKITDPWNEAKTAIIAAEKREGNDLDLLYKRLDGLAGMYAAEQARKIEEERRAQEAAERARAEAELAAQMEAERKAAEAAAANSAFGLNDPAAAEPVAPVAPPPPPPVAQPIMTQKAHSSSASFTEKWTFEVIDSNAVPRELCSPDPAKIRALLDAKKAEGYKADQILIEGLKISAIMQVRSR